jgi:hypothetical protein
MSRKEHLWHERMGPALNSRYLVASCLYNQEHPVDPDADPDDYEQVLRREEADAEVRDTELNPQGPGPTMTLGRAMDLHAALKERIVAAGKAPLDIVDAVGLEYLGKVLGVSATAERRLGVAGKFESGTITYQGNFERLRSRLKLGISMVNGWGEQWPTQNRITIQDVKVSNLTFSGTPAGDMDLQTTRVSGDIEFLFIILEDEEVTNPNALIEQVRVAIDPAQAPAPVQRVGLKDPVIISEELS